MQPKQNSDAHNQIPSDEITRDKINKHLSDINDTISEQDIKNINTTIPQKDSEAKEKLDERLDNEDLDNRDDKPKKEMPNVWDMVDE